MYIFGILFSQLITYLVPL